MPWVLHDANRKVPSLAMEVKEAGPSTKPTKDKPRSAENSAPIELLPHRNYFIAYDKDGVIANTKSANSPFNQESLYIY